MGGITTGLHASVTTPAVRETLTTQLRFHFPQIRSMEYAVDEILVSSDEPLDMDKLRRAVDRILGRFAAIPPGARSRKLFDASDPDAVEAWSHRTNRFPADVLGEAAAALAAELRRVTVRPGRRIVPGRAVTQRPGINVYGRESAALLAALDRFTIRCIVDAFNAEELLIPSLIGAETVDRSGYFKTGCQHLSFVAPVSNDPDVFEEFLPFWSGAAIDPGHGGDRRVLDYVKTPRDLLNPAACLHCYPLLEGQTVAADEVIAMTVGGSIFRDESGNLNNDERLYEFRMREGVFVGGSAPVARIHGQLMDLLASVGLLLGLDFALETASDMFFSDGAGAQLFAQLVSDSKIELVGRSRTLDRRVSSASLNKHGSHFSDAFDLRDERGLPASTMCIGFGLDRLAFLLFERHGTDLAAIASAIESNLPRAITERT